MAAFHVVLISDDHALIQGVRERFSGGARVTILHGFRRRLPKTSQQEGPVLFLVETLHASASKLTKLLRTTHNSPPPYLVIGTSTQLLHACDRLRSLPNESGQEMQAPVPGAMSGAHGNGSNGSNGHVTGGFERLSRPVGLDLSLGDFMERKFHEFVRKIKISGGKNLFQLLRHEFEKPLITLTLKETKHNQVQAAELLGMNRNTLRKKIRELKIPVKR